MGYLFSMDEPLFFAKHIRINGTDPETDKEILARVTPFLKANLFKIDAAKMKEAVVSHPFVKEVNIKRVFPFSLIIDVKEKKASALWVNGDGAVQVLDETGAPFRGLKKGDEKNMFLINARGQRGSEEYLQGDQRLDHARGSSRRTRCPRYPIATGMLPSSALTTVWRLSWERKTRIRGSKRAVAVFEDARKRGLLIKCIDARFEKGAIIQERKG